MLYLVLQDLIMDLAARTSEFLGGFAHRYLDPNVLDSAWFHFWQNHYYSGMASGCRSLEREALPTILEQLRIHNWSRIVGGALIFDSIWFNFSHNYYFSGMASGCRSLEREALPTILEQLRLRNGFSLLIVGYSLGAGLAQLFTRCVGKEMVQNF